MNDRDGDEQELRRKLLASFASRFRYASPAQIERSFNKLVEHRHIDVTPDGRFALSGKKAQN